MGPELSLTWFFLFLEYASSPVTILWLTDSYPAILFSGKIPWPLSSSQAIHPLVPIMHHKSFHVSIMNYNLLFICPFHNICKHLESRDLVISISAVLTQYADLDRVPLVWTKFENKYLEAKYGEMLMPGWWNYALLVVPDKGNWGDVEQTESVWRCMQDEMIFHSLFHPPHQ